MPSIDEQAALLTLTATGHLEPWRIARIIEQAGSAQALLDGDVRWIDRWRKPDAIKLAERADRSALAGYRRLIEQFHHEGTDLLTVLDLEYPFNLSQVPNRPPFLFVQGTLTEADEDAVAIAGDEADTPEWVARSHELAEGLAAAGVTVIAETGRPTGDAALSTAIDAGGRAIGVLDHGITHSPARVPPELARRLHANGALLSPSWPDAPPSESARAAAQAVTSGIASALLVVAGTGDGSSRRHARRCLEQGRTLVLDKCLVLHEPWAKLYSDFPDASVTNSAADVLDVLAGMPKSRPAMAGDDARAPRRDP